MPTPSLTWASAKVARPFAASMAVAPAGAKLGFKNANVVRVLEPVPFDLGPHSKNALFPNDQSATF
jgi:hypothetical protein